MSKEKYEPGFNFLATYLHYKYKVNTVLKAFEEDAYYSGANLICINKNNHWRDRLIALIHESGHVQLELGEEAIRNMKVNNSTYYSNVNSKKQFISLINEEITAWNLGKQLATSLNIKFDAIRLDEVSTNCIMSYLKTGLQEVYGKRINIEIIDPKV